MIQNDFFKTSALVFGKCRVVDFELEHLKEKYVAWLNDPEVVRFSEQRHLVHTIITCRDYFDSMRLSENHLFLAVEDNEGERGHIGNLAVYLDVFNDTADVSILLGDKDVWGKGYASDAWTGLIDFLLKSMNVRKVTAGTMASNMPMRRLMRRSGMHEESVRKAQFLYSGKAEDLILAAKFGGEY